MESKPDIYGRKVFFLYPHSVIETDIVEQIIDNEYEVYFLKDHLKAIRLLKRFRDSILFINIDQELREGEWETYVRSLMSNEQTESVRIGILTYNEDPSLARKYLMDLEVPCGFTRLKLGVAESTRIILTSLHANEAKGRRKFVRASTNGSDRATFNVKVGDSTLHGRLFDISVAGMAVTFDRQIDLPIKTVLQDMQLKLWGTLVRVHGVVTATRSAEGGGYLVMFGNRLSKLARQKIHTFVHRWLQHEMDEILKRV